MAYGPANNWWLNGPRDPRGWGCDSPRGCGMSGLGQTLPQCDDGSFLTSGLCEDLVPPTCPAGYSVTSGSGTYSCTNTLMQAGLSIPGVSPICPVGQTCSIIQGVSNTYVYLGGAALALFLLIGAMKGGR